MAGLAERLDELLEDRQLSRKAACDRAGVNETYIRDLLKHPGRNPRTDRIEALAAELGTTVDWLLKGKGPKHPEAPESFYDDDLMKECIGRAFQYTVKNVLVENVSPDDFAETALDAYTEFLMEDIEGRSQRIQDFVAGRLSVIARRGV